MSAKYIITERGYREQEQVTLARVAGALGCAPQWADVIAAAINAAGRDTETQPDAPAPVTAEARCSKVHVWTHQFGDDWSPERGTPCDCGVRRYGWESWEYKAAGLLDPDSSSPEAAPQEQAAARSAGTATGECANATRDCREIWPNAPSVWCSACAEGPQPPQAAQGEPDYICDFGKNAGRPHQATRGQWFCGRCGAPTAICNYCGRGIALGARGWRVERHACAEATAPRSPSLPTTQSPTLAQRSSQK